METLWIIKHACYYILNNFISLLLIDLNLVFAKKISLAERRNYIIQETKLLPLKKSAYKNS